MPWFIYNPHINWAVFHPLRNPKQPMSILLKIAQTTQPRPHQSSPRRHFYIPNLPLNHPRPPKAHNQPRPSQLNLAVGRYAWVLAARWHQQRRLVFSEGKLTRSLGAYHSEIHDWEKQLMVFFHGFRHEKKTVRFNYWLFNEIIPT